MVNLRNSLTPKVAYTRFVHPICTPKLTHFYPETKPTLVELLSIISFNWFNVGQKTSSTAIRNKIIICKLTIYRYNWF